VSFSLFWQQVFVKEKFVWLFYLLHQSETIFEKHLILKKHNLNLLIFFDILRELLKTPADIKVD